MDISSIEFCAYSCITFRDIPLNDDSPVAERFCAQNWKKEGAGFDSRSRLSTQPFGVFRGFLRNSRKCGLGSLIKTPTEGIPSIVPDLTSEQFDLNIQPINQPTLSMKKRKKWYHSPFDVHKPKLAQFSVLRYTFITLNFL